MSLRTRLIVFVLLFGSAVLTNIFALVYLAHSISNSLDAIENIRQRQLVAVQMNTHYTMPRRRYIATTSRNPVIRLLLVGLAFVIFNLYIAIRQYIAICLKNPVKPISKYWLTLLRLVRMIAYTVESLFQFADAVFRHSRFALS